MPSWPPSPGKELRRCFAEFTLSEANGLSMTGNSEGLPPRSADPWLWQAFNNFYHRFHILSEPDADRQQFLLYMVHLVNQTLTSALGLMGIEIPERM